MKQPVSCKILETGQVSVSDGVNCEDLVKAKATKRIDCTDLQSCESCLGYHESAKEAEQKKTYIKETNLVRNTHIRSYFFCSVFSYPYGQLCLLFKNMYHFFDAE